MKANMHRPFLFAISLGCLSPTLAKAEPIEETKQLYQSIIESSAALSGILTDLGEPAAAEKRISENVVTPLEAATQTWMNAAFKSGSSSKPYVQYRDCFDASFALKGFTVKIQRYLLGTDTIPFQSSDADDFRLELLNCELSIDVKPTFPLPEQSAEK